MIKKRGFTFIELNLVVILVAVIGFTIYSSFSAGTNIWKRQKNSAPVIDTHIFLNKISCDLRHGINFSPIAPCGTSRNLSLAIFQNGGNSICGFGRVTYVFDAASGILKRDYREFSNSVDKQPGNSSIILLSSLSSCSFKYYYFNAESRNGQWKDAMENGLPSAVKVNVSFVMNNKETNFSKIIAMYPGSY